MLLSVVFIPSWVILAKFLASQSLSFLNYKKRPFHL